MTILLILLSLIDIVPVFISAEGFQCPVNVENKVPTNALLEPTSVFQYLDAGLTICPAYTIPCDGLLTQWQFISVNPYVIGLHLGVFRRRIANLNVFDIVGTSYLNALHTPANLRQTWVYQPVDPPIPVNKSDVLGYFYDNFKTRNELLTLGSIHLHEDEARRAKLDPCLVSLTDNIHLGSSTMVDMLRAGHVYRIPGLVAVISPYGSVSAVTASPSTPTTDEEEEEANEEEITGTNSTIVEEIGNNFVSSSQEFQESSGDGDDSSSFESGGTGEIDDVPQAAPPALDLFESIIVSSHQKPTLTSNSLSPDLCLKTPTALQVCTEATMRAFFDYRQGHCQAFYGCPPVAEGTENNFVSLDHCQKTCYS